VSIETANGRAEKLGRIITNLQVEKDELLDSMKSLREDNLELKMKLDCADSTLHKKELEINLVLSEHADDKVKLEKTISELNDSQTKLIENELRFKSELLESQNKEKYLRCNIDELNRLLSSKENLQLSLNEQLISAGCKVLDLQGRLIDIEKSLEKKELERLDIEKKNLTLTTNLIQADSDKEELLRMTSDLKKEKDLGFNEINRLQEELNDMTDKFESAINKASVMEDWLNETKSVHENNERNLVARLEAYEDNEKRMCQSLSELERQVCIVII